jgi:hypothetical protein
MEKEFIPYEQALALKELGFDKEICFGRWTTYPDGEGFLDTTKHSIYQGRDDLNRQCLAPLYQQAFDFFEEKYFLSGEIQKQSPYQKVTKPYWWYMIQDEKGEDLSDWQRRFNVILDKAHQNIEGNFVDDDKFIKFLYDDNFAFETRTEAKLECLKKLIEIVKEKK